MSDPAHPVAENVLGRDFAAERGGQKWVCDTTFIPTDEGWLFLATMLDLYNREIVGRAMSDRNDQERTASALRMALQTHAHAAGGVAVPLGPRQHLHGRELPGAAVGERDGMQHEPTDRLPGRRGGGELPRDAEEGAGAP